MRIIYRIKEAVAGISGRLFYGEKVGWILNKVAVTCLLFPILFIRRLMHESFKFYQRFS